MAKLKTYITQTGFFDLAVAAPSMRAAVEHLGIPIQSFKKGFAKQTDEPGVVKATMAKPGAVLKRPVGSRDKFSQHAALPVIKVRPSQTVNKSNTTTAKEKQKTKAMRLAEVMRKKAAVGYQRASERHKAILLKLDEEASVLAKKRATEENKWAKEKLKLKRAEIDKSSGKSHARRVG